MLVACGDGDDDDDDEFDKDTATEEELCEHSYVDFSSKCGGEYWGSVEDYCYYYKDATWDFNMCREDYEEPIMSDPDCGGAYICDAYKEFEDCLNEAYVP